MLEYIFIVYLVVIGLGILTSSYQLYGRTEYKYYCNFQKK